MRDNFHSPSDPGALSHIGVLVAAIFVGISLPLLMSGRAPFAVATAIAVFAIVWSDNSTRLFRGVTDIGRTFLGLASMVTLLAWIPSTVTSSFPAESIPVLVRMAAFLVIAASVRVFLSHHQEAHLVGLRVLLCGTLMGIVIALPAMMAFPDLMLLLKARPAATLTAARLSLSSYASFAALLIPVVLWVAWRIRKRHWLWVSVLVTLGLLALIWLSDSRAALAGLLAALGAVVITFALDRTKQGYVLGLGSLFVVLAGAFSAKLYIDPDFPQLSGFPLFLPSWLIDPHRQLIWQNTISLALERPWLGFGIDTINLQDFSEVRARMAVDDASLLLPGHPHNWIIEVFSETGVVGTVPLLATVGVLFLTFLKDFRATGRPEPLVAVAVSAAYWVSGLFNFSFWSAWWQLAYLLLIAMLVPAPSNAKG